MTSDQTSNIGIRVVELADRRAQFCGKLFSDTGADVIQVEPIAGNPARLVPPFAGDAIDPEGSLDYWYYNTGKRSIALDLASPQGLEALHALLATADVFIESCFSEDLVPLGLDYASLSASNPGLIQASITDFGQDGPWRELHACDESHLALGGQMAASGYSDPRVSPMGGKGGQSRHMAGVLTAQAIMTALIERLSSGLGQYLDTSIHDCCAVCIEGSYSGWTFSGTVPARRTGEHAGMGTSTPMPPCADGRYVNTIFTELTQHMWINLVAWMEEVGVAGELTDPKYLDEVYRVRAMRGEPEIREGIARLLMALPADEVEKGAQDRCRLAWSVVRAPEENFDDPHWQQRDFFAPVEHPGVDAPVRYPSALFRPTELEFRPRGRAPRFGEHTQEVLASLGHSSEAISALIATGAIK